MFTQGPLYQAIMQGENELSQSTSYTIEIEDGDGFTAKERFSDLAMFVYQRATKAGCGGSGYVQKQIDGIVPGGADWGDSGQNGYPALEDTYLGKNPPCYGATSAQFDSPIAELTAELGNDMEGVYSREYFKVETEEPIKLTTGSGTWLEKKSIDGAVNAGYQSAVLEECKPSLVFTPTAQASFGLSKHHYVFFFEEDASGRSSSFYPYTSKRVYCTGHGAAAGPNLAANVINPSNPPPAQVILCPGDTGYIQTNRKEPLWDSEVGTNPNTYPHIVLTDLGSGTECEGVADNQQFSGTSSGSHLYVYSNVEGGGTTYPEVFNSKFKLRGSMAAPFVGEAWGETKPTKQRCQIVFRDRDWGAVKSPDDYLVQGVWAGEEIEQQSLADGGSYPVFQGVSPVRKWVEHSIPGNPDTEGEFSSSNPRSFVTLDGSELSNNPGELRVTSVGGDNLNQIYGDLLCVPGSAGSDAEFRLCTDGAPAEGSTVTIPASSENPYMIQDEEWKCEVGSGRYGEWRQVG
ncbi:hypothetical protein ATH50_3667 [Haloplanus aerogenes]|nr:hypothetical protein ATH50_3667 [Haloplanus aerogenes]